MHNYVLDLHKIRELQNIRFQEIFRSICFDAEEPVDPFYLLHFEFLLQVEPPTFDPLLITPEGLGDYHPRYTHTHIEAMTDCWRISSQGELLSPMLRMYRDTMPHQQGAVNSFEDFELD